MKIQLSKLSHRSLGLTHFWGHEISKILMKNVQLGNAYTHKIVNII